MREPAEAQKAGLLEQQQRDAAETKLIESRLREVVGEIKALDERLSAAGREPGAQVASADDTPEQRAEKYARLEAQEQEMRAFIAGAPELQDKAQAKLRDGQGEVLETLNELK